MSDAPQLVRDPSCLRDLSWQVKGPTDLKELQDRLHIDGWQNISPSDRLQIYRGLEHDELVIVPRTRRIQLRVSYRVAPAERAQRAREIFAKLFEIETAQ